MARKFDPATMPPARVIGTPAEATQELRRFLESTPPNVAVTIPKLFAQDMRGSTPWFTTLPEIELFCDRAGGKRWFNSTSVTTGGDRLYVHHREYTFVTSTCKDCTGDAVSSVTFALIVERTAGDAKIMKLGQFPPFGTPISKRVRKLLSDADLELYQKGLRCEAQGLGIGAATYFRRVVESQWETLVQECHEAAAKLRPATDLSIFDRALEDKSFSRAVSLLEDALPEKLLILDGQNPLTLLHRALSVQLHQLPDDQCLQQAADIRLVLTELLENLSGVLQDHAELKAAVTRLQQAGT